LCGRAFLREPIQTGGIKASREGRDGRRPKLSPKISRECRDIKKSQLEVFRQGVMFQADEVEDFKRKETGLKEIYPARDGDRAVVNTLKDHFKVDRKKNWWSKGLRQKTHSEANAHTFGKRKEELPKNRIKNDEGEGKGREPGGSEGKRGSQWISSRKTTAPSERKEHYVENSKQDVKKGPNGGGSLSGGNKSL